MVRPNRIDEEYKTATFLSAIGEEALEIYDGMNLDPPESAKNFASGKKTKHSSGTFLIPGRRRKEKALTVSFHLCGHQPNLVIFAKLTRFFVVR